jgi:chemotaxis signal transduction protein
VKYDETSRAIFEARARAIAEWPARGRSTAARSTPHLLFRIRDERLALPLSAVRAYLRDPHVARFPEAPEAVRGILAHEGAVITLLALERLLGHAEAAGSVTAAIVLETGTADVAFAIESEEGLQDIDVAQLVRHTGIIMGTLPDGRGIIDAEAVAADPRGMMTRLAEDHAGSEGTDR